MLSNEARIQAKQYNMRARQILWRGILPESHDFWRLNDEEIIDRTLDYQTQHDLKPDGRFGPAALMTWLAEEKGGGIGGVILGGEEIRAENLRVARMFKPDNRLTKAEPDLACILTIPELAYACRDRMNQKTAIRAHFSIDSSEGNFGESTIIQWADPLFAVPFCPTTETMDYPRQRQCVGIELENVLLLYQLDADERQWAKRRKTVKSVIGDKTINQPALYPCQIKALDRLLTILEKNAGIPRAYPSQNGQYLTALLDGDQLASHKGCLAKYHYFTMNHEPGAGFAEKITELFGEPNDRRPVATPEPEPVQEENRDRQILTRKLNTQQQDLANFATTSASFAPAHEDTPRFNLSRAIAQAYQTGKAARAARISRKSSQNDDD